MTWEEADIRRALVDLARALSSGHHALDEDEEQFVEDMIELDEDCMSREQILRLRSIFQAYEQWAEEHDNEEDDI